MRGFLKKQIFNVNSDYTNYKKIINNYLKRHNLKFWRKENG